MALIDQQNKVIYWDEVNWQWLPNIRKEKSNNFFLIKGNRRFSIKSPEDVINLLKSFNYSIASLQSLGFVEVCRCCFLYKGRLYQLSKTNPSLLSLLSYITGEPKHRLSVQIQGKGVLTKGFIDDLVFGSVSNKSSYTPKSKKKLNYTYKGKLYESYVSLAEEVGISSVHLYRGLTSGKSVEETVKYYKSKVVNFNDHLGNSLPSLGAMCKYWGISKTVYHGRIRRGWSLERTLTYPVKLISK